MAFIALICAGCVSGASGLRTNADQHATNEETSEQHALQLVRDASADYWPDALQNPLKARASYCDRLTRVQPNLAAARREWPAVPRARYLAAVYHLVCERRIRHACTPPLADDENLVEASNLLKEEAQRHADDSETARLLRAVEGEIHRRETISEKWSQFVALIDAAKEKGPVSEGEMPALADVVAQPNKHRGRFVAFCTGYNIGTKTGNVRVNTTGSITFDLQTPAGAYEVTTPPMSGAIDLSELNFLGIVEGIRRGHTGGGGVLEKVGINVSAAFEPKHGTLTVSPAREGHDP